MKRFILTVVVLLSSLLPFLLADQPEVEIRYSPFNAVQLAEEDAGAVASLQDKYLDPTYIRYLSMHNTPENQRLSKKLEVDFTLNSLNPKYRKIVRTAGVPAKAQIPIVLRVNLKDYGIDPKAWDRLAENGSGPTPLPDPYFHRRTVQAAKIISVIKQLKVVKSKGVPLPHAEIVIEVPGMVDIYFDNRKVSASTAAQRKFKTHALKSANYHYTIRVTGKYNDQKYDLNTHFEFVAGDLIKITVPVAALPTKVANKKVLASEPCLAIEPEVSRRGTTIASLIKLTNTKNPILRADWFVVYATWAPAYYDLIGLKLKPNPNKATAKLQPKVFLEKDFEKLFSVDKKAAAKDILAAITDTRIVTLHNRILQRFNTVTGVTGGCYWRSIDTDTGIDDQDYLNQIGNFDKPKFVAKEIIASGRNGLNFYFVSDNKGAGLNLAAASVAQHSEAMPTKYQDKQIWVSRNCMLCHANGMISVKDQVRHIAQDKIALFISDKTNDRKLALKIEEAFSTNVQSVLDLDNARFSASVKAACGKTGLVIAKAQELSIYGYFDQKVTLKRMARDAGLTSAKLKACLKEGINLDHTLTQVLQTVEEPVALLVYERQGYAALMDYLISYNSRRR